MLLSSGYIAGGRDRRNPDRRACGDPRRIERRRSLAAAAGPLEREPLAIPGAFGLMTVIFLLVGLGALFRVAEPARCDRGCDRRAKRTCDGAGFDPRGDAFMIRRQAVVNAVPAALALMIAAVSPGRDHARVRRRRDVGLQQLAARAAQGADTASRRHPAGSSTCGRRPSGSTAAAPGRSSRPTAW